MLESWLTKNHNPLESLHSNRSGSGAVVRSTLSRDGPSGVRGQRPWPFSAACQTRSAGRDFAEPKARGRYWLAQTIRCIHATSASSKL